MTDFKKGDKVKYSELAHAKLGGRHMTGTVVSNAHPRSETIRIQHDGIKYPYTYHKNFWILDHIGDANEMIDTSK